MKKVANIILYALLIIAVVPILLWVFGVFGPFDHGYIPGSGDTSVFGGADVMLIIAFVYLVIAALAMVVMALMNMGKGRGNSKLSLWVFGGTAVLAVIFYFTFAKSDIVFGADGKPFDNVFTLKATDAGLYLTYALVIFTVITLLWGTIRKALK
jgi:hypothetical protein